MDIKVWGPGLWELIHTIAYGYNNNPVTARKKNQYVLFFKSLRTLIPCNKCRYHYNIYLTKNSINKAVQSHNRIITWVNNLHNYVNRSLKKKIYTLVESRRKYYNNNLLLINHNKICNFIDGSLKTVNVGTLNAFKQFFNSLYHIYPCEICRLKFNTRDRKIRLHSTNILTIKKWYSNMNIRNTHK